MFLKIELSCNKISFATNSQKYDSLIYNAMFEIHCNHKIVASVSFYNENTCLLYDFSVNVI
jgi:hypothetical protein